MRWPLSSFSVLRLVLVCLRPHLSERLYPLFHGGLPQSVDVEEACESVALGSGTTVPVFSLQYKWWWQRLAISAGRALVGSALPGPEIKSTER